MIREGRQYNASTVQQLYQDVYPLFVPSTRPSKSSSKFLRICRAQQPWKVRPNAFVEKNRTRHTSWMPIVILPLLYMSMRDPAAVVPAVVNVDAGAEPRGMRTRREEDMRMPQLKMPGGGCAREKRSELQVSERVYVSGTQHFRCIQAYMNVRALILYTLDQASCVARCGVGLRFAYCWYD